MYNERLAKIHFWIATISVNVTFFPQHFIGLAGMPRRIPDYALQFADFNLISSIGSFAFGLSFILFTYILVDCIRNGKPAVLGHGRAQKARMDFGCACCLSYV